MPVLLVHGLIDDPFMYNDMMVALNRTPGFLDRYQIWVFRYPTGITFLRSAALLRADLRDALSTFDPQGHDPALQNMVLVGYSMGGLLCKLQVTSSGDRLWAVAANRPLDSLVTSEQTRSFLREHLLLRADADDPPGDLHRDPARRLARRQHADRPACDQGRERPSDTAEAIAQIDRDNPGALRPFLLRRLPSSIDVLAADNPLLPAMRQLPFSPAVTLHTIAGHGVHSPDRARGDLVVPLSSATLTKPSASTGYPRFTPTSTTIRRRSPRFNESSRCMSPATASRFGLQVKVRRSVRPAELDDPVGPAWVR